MASPFKLNPVGGFTGTLQARSKLWKTDSPQKDHHKIVVRNPAYCNIQGGLSLPDKNYTNALGSVYSTFKLGNILKSATLTSGGDYGLTMKLEFEVESFTKGNFQAVANAYMNFRKKVGVSFGYPNPFPDSGYDTSGTLTDFQVVGFSFSTTDAGSWVSKITAVGPGEGQLSADMTIQPVNLGKAQYKSKNGEMFPVSNLAELVTYHAQGNGKVATAEQTSGYVNDCPHPGGQGPMGACVVFDLRPILVEAGFLKRQIAMVKNLLSDEDDCHCYFTLDYIVNMWNKVARFAYPDAVTAGVAIEFDSKYSKSYIPGEIKSARPVDILLLGGGMGNYKGGGAGINFEDECQNLGAVNCAAGVAGSRRIINPRKILVERGIIFAALNSEKPEKKSAENNNVQETQEANVSLKSFFNTIFGAIDKATGGAIKLRLAHRPSVLDSGGAEMKKMIIVDENNGKLEGNYTCIVFDPIKGDGSTRSCTLTSDAGSQTYQAAMFAGTHKSGDPCQVASGGDPNAQRVAAYNKAKEALTQLTVTPGKLQKSGFSEESMKAMEEANSALVLYGGGEKKTYDTLTFTGLGIDVEIDGAYGIIPGCAVSTTQMPKGYKPASGIYFYVDTVTHHFDGETSDWSTKITGKLSLTDSLSPVNL